VTLRTYLDVVVNFMSFFCQHLDFAYFHRYFYYVLSGVTIEAEAGITIYGQCRGQVILAHCTASLMYASYVFVWVMCCSCYYSNSRCKSVGKPGLCVYSTLPVSSSAGIYAIPLTALGGP